MHQFLFCLFAVGGLVAFRTAIDLPAQPERAERTGEHRRRPRLNFGHGTMSICKPQLCTVITPPPMVMSAAKAPGTFRIFIFGESAVLGDPCPNYGAGSYLEVLLAERFPQAKFEVVNTGITAINSHVILPIRGSDKSPLQQVGALQKATKQGATILLNIASNAAAREARVQHEPERRALFGAPVRGVSGGEA